LYQINQVFAGFAGEFQQNAPKRRISFNTPHKSLQGLANIMTHPPSSKIQTFGLIEKKNRSLNVENRRKFLTIF